MIIDKLWVQDMQNAMYQSNELNYKYLNFLSIPIFSTIIGHKYIITLAHHPTPTQSCSISN